LDSGSGEGRKTDIMRKIFKYELETVGTQVLTLPADSTILCVQVQRGVPCIWADIDAETSAIEQRKFRIYGTGHPIDESEAIEYIGTYQLYQGDFVGHVFEVIK
jgi:hypothetical protein